VGKGTGLGLATAYGIVKQSGGYIRVRAVPGQGAEFLIYLPRTTQKAERNPACDAQPSVFGSGRVLVVEDEPGVRSALQRILEAGGYTVLAAANGKDGLELFARSEHPVDLLIADLVMPGMGGRELAKKCRELHDVLKILYVSGYTKDSLLSQQTFEDGIQFLEKPFTRDGVLERVRQVLR
jgi:two-component system cell cycle sensor histidine kinase/response regulator CckA